MGNEVSSARGRRAWYVAPMSRPRIAHVALLGALAALPLALGQGGCARTEHFGGPPVCVGLGCPDGGLLDGGPAFAPPSDAAPPLGSSAPPASASPSASASTGEPTPRTTPDAIDQGIEIAVRQLALKAAPKGATPDGQPLRVDLTEGQRAGQVVTLQPNTCYTFIAAGVPGVVQELEVRLLLPPFFTMEASKGRGHPAVVGRVPAAVCPISPVALPYRVEVTATKGSGRVGLMVFGKPR